MTTEIQIGINDSVADILARYSSSTAINSVVFNNLSNLNVEQDVITTLQSHSAGNTSFWDKFYLAPAGPYVDEALSDFIFDTTTEALKAQSNLALTITNSIKLLTTTTVSIERSVIEYFNGLPGKVFVNKITGQIVTSETVFSETTHIPFGKVLAGVAKGIEACAVYETFRDTVISAYQAQTGQGDTFTPLKNYLIAGVTVLSGGAAAVAAAPYVGAGLLAVGAGAVVAGGAGWAAETIIGNLQSLVNQAKALY